MRDAACLENRIETLVLRNRYDLVLIAVVQLIRRSNRAGLCRSEPGR